jgi:hypothetical protein
VLREPLPDRLQVQELFVDEEAARAEDAVDFGKCLRDLAKVMMGRTRVMDRNECENHIVRRIGEWEVQYVCLAEDEGGGQARREMAVQGSLSDFELPRVQVGRDVLDGLKTFDEPGRELAASAPDFEADRGRWDRRIHADSSERASGATASGKVDKESREGVHFGHGSIAGEHALPLLVATGWGGFEPTNRSGGGARKGSALVLIDNSFTLNPQS